MKNVLVISSILRGGSNSEILAKKCSKGAEDALNHSDVMEKAYQLGGSL